MYILVEILHTEFQYISLIEIQKYNWNRKKNWEKENRTNRDKLPDPGQKEPLFCPGLAFPVGKSGQQEFSNGYKLAFLYQWLLRASESSTKIRRHISVLAHNSRGWSSRSSDKASMLCACFSGSQTFRQGSTNRLPKTCRCNGSAPRPTILVFNAIC